MKISFSHLVVLFAASIVFVTSSSVFAMGPADTLYDDWEHTVGIMALNSSTYEGIMKNYSVDRDIFPIGPSRLLGRLYGALTASGSSEDRVSRLEIALLYDKVLVGKQHLETIEAGVFETSMPDVKIYNRIRLRLEKEQKALEKFGFVRIFRHDYKSSIAARKAVLRVFDYFDQPHNPGDAEKRIAKMEERLKNKPPKDDKTLLAIFIEKELMKEYRERLKMLEQQEFNPEELEGNNI